MFGLALEGGGVRGAFHMGAVKALLEEGYEFGGVTGTSIGALNGAIIAQGDFEAGYRLWENMDAPLLFDIEEEQYRKLIDRRFDKELLLKLVARMGVIIEDKGIDTGKMRQVIEDIVDENKLREAAAAFGLVTVSLTDLKPLELYKEDIPEGKMVDYLMASASFPGFKMSPIDDKYFIDGGFYDNCPINLLARKGFKEIIAVRTFGMGVVQHVRYRNVKVVNIVPSEDLGMTLDFSRELIHRNLRMGYFDAMRSIKDLRGRKYYIKPMEDGKAFDVLCGLPDNLVRDIGKLFKFKDMPAKRMLFEKIIPELAHLLGLKASSSYQDILVGMLEAAAEEKCADRYRIYSIDELIGEIERCKSDSIRRSRGRSQKADNSINKKLADALKKKHVLKQAALKGFEAVKAVEAMYRDGGEAE